MKRYLAIVLAALMLCAAFAGCAGGGKKKESAHGWVNHYMSEAPATINHFVASTSTLTDLITSALYVKLINEDYTGTEYLPSIAAENPEQLDTEGKQWRIKLRKDYMWADNSSNITVDDIIYSMQMLLDPLLYNSQSSNATGAYSAPINAYEYQQEQCTWEEVGIKKVDDHTFDYITANPTTQQDVVEYWTMTCTAPVHKTTFEKNMSEDRSANSYGTSLDTFVSSGAFMITEWIPDGKVTVARNPNFPYSDRIKIEGINYRVVADAQTALELFEKGEIDCVSIETQLWEAYEDDPRVYEYFDDSLMYMFVNMGNPNQNGLLGNWNFRDALYWGTDREAMCEVVQGYPASRYVRNSVIGDKATGTPYVKMPDSTDFIDDPYEIYLPEKANASLAKALEECDLTSASMEIIYPEGSATSRARNEVTQKQYSETFGGKLEVKLRAVPSNLTLTLRRWDPNNPTSFEIAIGSLYPSSSSPHYSFMYFTSDYNPPRFCYSNPEFDALYARAESREAQSDNELLLSLCYQMEEIILNDRAIIPLYERPDKLLFSERIQIPTEEYVLGLGLAMGSGFGYPQYVSISD